MLLNIEVRMMRVSLLESAYNYLTFVGNRLLNLALVFLWMFYFLVTKCRSLSYKSLRQNKLYWYYREFKLSQYVNNMMYFFTAKKTN